ncbi:hypothetical protein MHYMCMPSP_00020 [Hyalomma marginatum]|nr:hypothetical protein MHYMCMPSP_00020 [Hyalomma marginatum]
MEEVVSVIVGDLYALFLVKGLPIILKQREALYRLEF